MEAAYYAQQQQQQQQAAAYQQAYQQQAYQQQAYEPQQAAHTAQYQQQAIVFPTSVPAKKAFWYRKAEEEEEDLYCTCRMPYRGGVFMIGCEICDQWFHGPCVGVKTKDAQSIKKYFCPACERTKGLQVGFDMPQFELPRKKGTRNLPPRRNATQKRYTDEPDMEEEHDSMVQYSAAGAGGGA